MPTDAADPGEGITAAYEGWFRDNDGSLRLLIGYFNRGEAVDVPVGSNNKIEPGGPDRGQPAYFLPGRQWGIFTIRVPEDFDSNSITWTLNVRGQTTEIPMKLRPLWEVSPHQEATMGNTPPTIWFSRNGPPQQGPPVGIHHSLSTVADTPTTIKVWSNDDEVIDPYRRGRPGPKVIVTWSKFRGPGDVWFDKSMPPIRDMDGSSTVIVRFSESGEYLLRVQANDLTREGGGGTQCCWTNALVRVTVTR